MTSQSHDTGKGMSPRTSWPGRRRGQWVLGAVTVIVASAVVAALRTLHPPAGPPSDVTREAEVASVAPAGETVITSPSEWTVPLFDTVNMQRAVSERLMRTRAEVLRQPSSPEAWGILGAVCHAHDLYECAESCYRRAHALDPEDFRFAYMLAVLLDTLGRGPDEFITLYRNAARLKPEYPQTYHRIGDKFVQLGRLADAREAYLLAAKLAPDFCAAHRSLGQTALSLGEPQAAVDHLERALELAPDDGIIHATLGRAYTALGYRERAKQAAAKSHTLERRYGFPDPLVDEMRAMASSSPACYNRAKRLIKADMTARALSWFRSMSLT